MAEQLNIYDRITEILNRPNSYILVTLSNEGGIQVKAEMSNLVSKRVIATLMANKDALIDGVRGAIIKDLMSKNMEDYMNQCLDELQKTIDIPYVTPLTCGGR